MRKYLTFLILCMLACAHVAFAGDMDAPGRRMVSHLIELCAHQERQALAEFIGYPTKRWYPLSAIHDSEEFLQRSDEYLDDTFMTWVAGSDIDKDWDRVGSRGYMLDGGMLWLDYQGKIVAINKRTAVAKARRAALIQAIKETLAPELRTFSEPMLAWKTRTRRLRVDKLKDKSFRLTVWPADAKLHALPHTLLLRGRRYSGMGSCPDDNYEFKDRGRVYHVHIHRCGTDDTKDTFTVEKGGEMLLEEEVLERGPFLQ